MATLTRVNGKTVIRVLSSDELGKLIEEYEAEIKAAEEAKEKEKSKKSSSSSSK